jgi:hypothetical protein
MLTGYKGLVDLCRWAHKQGSLQTNLATRLLESHPSSLPLLVLRGHAQMLSSKPASALHNYFKVFFLHLSTHILIDLPLCLACLDVKSFMWHFTMAFS